MEHYRNLSLEDLDGEVWRPIDGFENYMISNFGRVKSLTRYEFFKNHTKVSRRIRKSKILRFSFDSDGYIHYGLSKNGKGNTRKLHRLIAIAFIPNPENKPCINHINGIKTDNRIENLEWCTVMENNIHGIANGLIKPSFGENNGQSKLNTIKVRIIKRLFNDMSDSSIGKIFNMSSEGIRKIRIGKTWTHIK